MKSRFTTVDIITIIQELQQYVGMRVNQVYDIDNKTYLIKLHKPEAKVVLLIESGTRIHLTEFEWPKNPAPSGFSMKLRKHVNNKRLERVCQLGVDRVVDIQFGSGDAAYHLILEMYDRGNLVLTDHEYKIFNILRPRVAGEEKFLVRETYPVELAKQEYSNLTQENLTNLLKSGKPTDTLKKVLMPHFEFGPSLLEHLCQGQKIAINKKLKDWDMEKEFPVLCEALGSANSFFTTAPPTGIIVQKAETRPRSDGEGEEEFLTLQEFHPYLYHQHSHLPILSYPTFNSACDHFFSQLEAQKIEMKTVQQERSALKKLENVKKDHESRIRTLQELQAVDRRKGELIQMNSSLVDNATRVVVSAIANQIPWDQIKEIIREATEKGDPVASRIKQLKLDTNRIVMQLLDPYAHLDSDDEDLEEEEREDSKELMVEIDLDLTAQANARKYFVQKKAAATKEKKTVESGSVALKSAEKKTKQTLKEMATISNINKARKVYWFEKFYWFISSENFLVIGGRDAQQNELIVKRYMRPGDVYVHADLHGASSLVVKNPNQQAPVPPKTLTEAGQFAVCFSAAWDSKVITSAYWVHPDQVSKTAPSGEYLTVGSFMIRGKKNFLPPSHLIMGFSFLFKLEESSVERHKDERRVRGLEDNPTSEEKEAGSEAVSENLEDLDIAVEDGESSEEEEEGEGAEDFPAKMEVIKEEEPGNDSAAEASSAESSEPDNEEETPAEEDVNGGTGSGQVEEDSTEIGAKKEEMVEFPDTDVKIGYNRLGSVEIQTRTVSVSGEEPDTGAPATKDRRAAARKSGKPQKLQGPSASSGAEAAGPGARKGGGGEQVRGKKGKLKKMKEKYKDQDEEEREMKMKILQSDGPEKVKTKKGKKGKGGGGQPHQPREKRPPPQPKSKEGGEEGGEEVEEERTVNDETDMLDSLTGVPVSEDEILFAVPVCAPYNTLINYKYKVKLTPGTGKRGKACKTALAMFMVDRNTTAREKDLLKSVKDQDLARNLPGKVKLSAPHLQRVKGKK